jgi:hypothetical protein
MLEKNFKMHINFFQWLKIGALSAFIAIAIAWGMLTVLAPLMPENHERVLPAAHAPAH